jgi:hypothetical protein
MVVAFEAKGTIATTTIIESREPYSFAPQLTETAAGPSWVTADLLLVYTLAFTAGEAAKEVSGMKGKVAALVGPEEVEVKEFDVPEPEPGAVLVKVRRANVCGSEVHIYHFHHPLIRNASSATSSSARLRPSGKASPRTTRATRCRLGIA